MSIEVNSSDQIDTQIFEQIKVGSLIEGKILSIRKKDLIIDFNWKSEAVIPIAEFFEDDKAQIKVGSCFHVYIISLDDGDGNVIASREKAIISLAEQELHDAYEKKRAVVVKIQKQVKAGYMLSYKGMNIFMPGSMSGDIGNVIAQGQDFIEIKINRFQSDKYNPSRKGIIGSRDEFLKERNLSDLQDFFAGIKIGDILEGVVKNNTHFGIFVDLKYTDGLVHLSDISWERIRNIEERYPKGTRIKVKVLDIQDQRLSLGIKQLYPDPWKSIDQELQVGSIYDGSICNITDYGVFVSIDKVKLEGLVHLSSISWSGESNEIKNYKVGQRVKVYILEINSEIHRISLSFKHCTPNPWDKFTEQFAVGSKVQGKISNVTDFGIFVKLDKSLEGLVHVSDIDWLGNQGVENYKKGQEIECVILKINQEKERISLGIKQLTKHEYDRFINEHSIDEIIPLIVYAISDKGIIAKIKNYDCKAFIPNSMVVGKPQLDSEISARLVSFNKNNCNIVLSMKTKKPTTTSGHTKHARSTLGDLLPDDI